MKRLAVEGVVFALVFISIALGSVLAIGFVVNKIWPPPPSPLTPFPATFTPPPTVSPTPTATPLPTSVVTIQQNVEMTFYNNQTNAYYVVKVLPGNFGDASCTRWYVVTSARTDQSFTDCQAYLPYEIGHGFSVAHGEGNTYEVTYVWPWQVVEP